MIKRYVLKSPKFIEACQYTGTDESSQEVQRLTGMSIVSYKHPIFGVCIYSLSKDRTYNYNLCFNIGDFIFKDENGQVGIVKERDFNETWVVADSENST